MKLLFFSLSLYFLACDAEFYGKKSGVISLTPKNFKDVAESPGLTMVEFYAPWCGHCKSLKPEWIKAAQQLAGVVTFAAVDCDAEMNKQLAGQYGIQGFPTIKAFVGKRVEDFKGGRTASAIVEFATSKIPSYVKILKDGKEGKFLGESLPKALLFTKKGSTSALYKSLSGIFKDKIVFGEARQKKNKELAKKYGVSKFPTLLFIPASDGDSEPEPVKYEGKLKGKNLTKFLRRQLGEEFDDEKLPVLHDQSCMDKYCVAPGGLCVILVTTADEAEAVKYHDILKEVEEGRTDALFNFAVMDGVKQQKFAEEAWDMSLDFTKLVVFSAKKKSYIEFLGAYTAENVEDFLRGVLTGRHRAATMENVPELEGDTKLCPKVEKKERPKKPKKERPKERSGGGGSGDAPKGNFVVPLTEDNFDDILSNRKLPMMVEFFAPWCGHCKTLAPEWAKAARNLKGMVTFATVDATEEQSLAARYGIQGYPTIKFFPARPSGDPFDAVDYQGGRTGKALAQHALNSLTDHDVVYLKTPVHMEEWVLETQKTPKLFLLSEKTSVPTLFKALSIAFDGSIEFAFVPSSNKQLIEQFQIEEFPKIILMVFREPEEGAEGAEAAEPNFGFVPYDGALNFPALFQWLMPLVPADGEARSTKDEPAEEIEISVPEITNQSDFQKECFDKLGLCVVAFFEETAAEDAAEGTSPYINAFLNVKKAHIHDPYHFAWIGREKQPALMSAFGLSYDGPVSMVVMNARKKAYINYIGSFTEENIHEFLSSVLSGNLRTSSIKEIPEVVSTSGDGEDGEKQEIGHAQDNDEDCDADGICTQRPEGAAEAAAAAEGAGEKEEL